MKKCPSSDWLGFPDLRKEDITQESFKHSHFLSEALVANRLGRINLLLDREEYTKFLAAVKRRLGNDSSLCVDKAAHEAIADWISKGD